MKVYCGTYAKYNAGSLAGAWLDLDDYDSYEEFCAACRKLHADEADPELMMQDYEADEAWERAIYEESGTSSYERYYQVREALEDSGCDAETLSAYIEATGCEVDEDTPAKAAEAFVGEYDSDEDFAESLWSDCGYLSEVPDRLQCYIDWSRVARDLMFDYHEANGHYFAA